MVAIGTELKINIFFLFWKIELVRVYYPFIAIARVSVRVRVPIEYKQSEIQKALLRQSSAATSRLNYIATQSGLFQLSLEQQ